jgi:hypothetical protein
MMTRRILLMSALAAGVWLAAAADASAQGRRLAIGAAGGYPEPPGYIVVPVYNRSVGSGWTTADTSMGRAFREPIYTTPRGYRYAYVRGYTLRRVYDPGRPVIKRIHIKKTAVPSRRAHRGACVTDNGYGRHEYCR